MIVAREVEDDDNGSDDDNGCDDDDSGDFDEGNCTTSSSLNNSNPNFTPSSINSFLSTPR